MNRSKNYHDYLINGLFFVPQYRSDAADISIPDLCGWTSSIKNSYANRVRFRSTTGSKESLQEILHVAKQLHIGLTWIVSDIQYHNGVGAMLMNAGFKLGRFSLLDGMHLNTNSFMQPVEDDIFRVSATDTLEHLSLITDSYGHDSNDTTIFLNRSNINLGSLNFRYYYGFKKGSADPIGYARSIFDSKNRLVYLSGSAVLASNRRQGLYRQLVTARIRDAVLMGYTNILVQADAQTSSKFLSQVGFERVCNIRFFEWTPRDA